MSSVIDPLELNNVSVEDALIYAIAVDTQAQTAALTLEVDPVYHAALLETCPVALQQALSLVDLVFGGVESCSVEKMPNRSAAWAHDEKPHDYEIASLKVRKVAFRDAYHAEVRCQLGQSIAVVFTTIELHLSSRPVGAIHDYATAKT